MQIDMKSKYNIAHCTTSGFHLPFHLKCERSHSIFGIYKCIFGLSTIYNERCTVADNNP